MPKRLIRAMVRDVNNLDKPRRTTDGMRTVRSHPRRIVLLVVAGLLAAAGGKP